MWWAEDKGGGGEKDEALAGAQGLGSMGETYSSCSTRPRGSREPWLTTFYTLIQAANQMPGTRTSGKHETQLLPSRNLQSSRNTAVNQPNTTVINGIQKIPLLILSAYVQCRVLRSQEKYHGSRVDSWSATASQEPRW